MAIYIDYEGITGGATAGKYEDLIDVESVEFGVGRGISMEVGSMTNRENTKPNFSEITITKTCDSSCSAIFQEACVGTTGKKVSIKFCRTGGTNIQEYMTYELKDVLISSYSINGAKEGEPEEVITLSYSSIEICYTEYEGENKTGQPKRCLYNLKTATM